MGETRRDAVDLPDRRVKLDIFERRTAFLGALEGFVTRPAEVREVRREEMRMRTAMDEHPPRTYEGIMVVGRRFSLL